MTRYALLSAEGEVVNVILWDGEDGYQPPDELTAVACPDEAGPGWQLQEGEWVAPVEPPEDPIDPQADAREEAVSVLVGTFGVSEPVARVIAGLPPGDAQ